jgi:hypothetical protein
MIHIHIHTQTYFSEVTFQEVLKHILKIDFESYKPGDHPTFSTYLLWPLGHSRFWFPVSNKKGGKLLFIFYLKQYKCSSS